MEWMMNMQENTEESFEWCAATLDHSDESHELLFFQLYVVTDVLAVI